VRLTAAPEGVDVGIEAMVPMDRLERLSPVFVTRPMNRLIHEMSGSGHKRTQIPTVNSVCYEE
jgi:hypothetical protein